MTAPQYQYQSEINAFEGMIQGQHIDLLAGAVQPDGCIYFSAAMSGIATERRPGRENLVRYEGRSFVNGSIVGNAINKNFLSGQVDTWVWDRYPAQHIPEQSSYGYYMNIQSGILRPKTGLVPLSFS